MVSYPENIIRDVGLEKVFGRNYYTELSQDQLAGLEYALNTFHVVEEENPRYGNPFSSENRG